MPTGSAMAAGRFIAGVAVCLLLGVAAGVSQPVHQFLFWPAATVQLGEGKTGFSGEGTLQSRFTGRPGRLQVLVATAHLRYRVPGTPLLLAGGYVTGYLPALGGVRLVQVYGHSGWPECRGRPSLRAAYDYLWYSEAEQPMVRPASNGRVRLLMGLSPRLGKKGALLLTGEPFLYGQRAWLPETRVQAGLRRQLGADLSVDLLYFNRWRRPPAAVGRHQWEHACQLVVHYTVSKLPGDALTRGLFDGR